MGRSLVDSKGRLWLELREAWEKISVEVSRKNTETEMDGGSCCKKVDEANVQVKGG